MSYRNKYGRDLTIGEIEREADRRLDPPEDENSHPKDADKFAESKLEHLIEERERERNELV
jgi:hypothetical protein